MGAYTAGVSWWLIAWVVWGVYFCVVEGLALANRRDGDTLSEHVWAFVGARRGSAAWRPVTGWTKVRRFAVGLFMVTLGVHFLIGSDTIGNAALIGSAVVLAAVVAGTGIARVVRARRKDTDHGGAVQGSGT